MALYVLSDLHLSLSAQTDKSMEVFGPRWANYTERIQKAWTALVEPQDTVLIGGDLSWALTLEEAKEDLAFLHSLPGKKILLKGNHDFWWTTLKKMNTYLEDNGYGDICFLQNSAYLCDGMVICGARGWFYEKDDAATHTGADYERMIAREVGRLELSLKAAEDLTEGMEDRPERIVFLHFPPLWNGTVCQPIMDVLTAHGIRRCYFGHIHGAAETQFEESGITFTLTAADALGFVPKRVFPSAGTENISAPA